MMLDFTLVVAIDSGHVGQLQKVWPTWRRHKPELLDHPMLVIADGSNIGDWERQLSWLDHPNREIVCWSWPYDLKDPLLVLGQSEITQRERMLTAFVKVPPRLVETPYWLKIDTDCVASKPGPWIDDEWFVGNPALVSNSWGYTKPAHLLVDVQRWAETVPELASRPPLAIGCTSGEVCRYPRIISWLCFVNTEFSRHVLGWVPGRLPVPSQDTYHWYCAERLGLPIVKKRFSNMGWGHWHTQRTLEAMSREALA